MLNISGKKYYLLYFIGNSICSFVSSNISLAIKDASVQTSVCHSHSNASIHTKRVILTATYRNAQPNSAIVPCQNSICSSSRNSASKIIRMKVLDYPACHASVFCHTISVLHADKVNVTEKNGNAIANSAKISCAIYWCTIASSNHRFCFHINSVQNEELLRKLRVTKKCSISLNLALINDVFRPGCHLSFRWQVGRCNELTAQTL